MSLRSQLLAFGLLTLVLPWAGYRYVQELEAALRSGLERSLLASAGTVGAALDDQAVLLRAAAAERSAGSRGAKIYGAPLRAAPRVDGVRDDWGVDDSAAVALDGGHRFFAGVHERYVYLFVDVRDDDLVYQASPGVTPYGDRLWLAVEPRPGAREWLLLATPAPGAFRTQLTVPPLFAPSGSYEDRISSAWQETPQGYAVEIRVPLNLVGDALGIAVIDVDRGAGGSAGAQGYTVEVAATFDADTGAPGHFIYQRPELERIVAQFGQAGDRFRVVDRDGWVLSDTGRVRAADRETAPVAGGLAGDLIRLLLRRDDPDYRGLERPPGRLADGPLRAALDGAAATAWFRSGSDQSTIVVAAAPIESPGGVLGAVLLEQASDPILTLTNQALVRLLTSTLIATLVAAAGLLGFATLLSFRVRRLARAAESAVGPKGEIDTALPGRTAGDELGDLTRSFGRLLERLREHTQYLRTLTGKLSHELRTPLAVVSTSLDNLEHEVDSPAALPYLKRLRDGTARLDSILAAMSEATRMEQAIGDTAPERFDLAAVVESCWRAYIDVYPDRKLTLDVGARDAAVVGSGELAAQLIDKLVDNAVGFSPTGSVIGIALTDTGAELELAVTNRGSKLPEAMREQLFDSLVSVRDGGDGRPHLGLGLYIVALIAEFHGGRVAADNLADGSGVVFRVAFPKAPR
jgi:two-component system, OmpR family, sensor histidine kinase ChvG